MSGPQITATLLEPGARFDGPSGARLVDVLDRLLDRGVVIRAELWLTVADVDLVYLGASIVLASPDAINRTSEPALPCG